MQWHKCQLVTEVIIYNQWNLGIEERIQHTDYLTVAQTISFQMFKTFKPLGNILAVFGHI